MKVVSIWYNQPLTQLNSAPSKLGFSVWGISNCKQQGRKVAAMGRNTIRGNISTFVGNALGGVRGRQNAAAWAVAFTAAYFLWIKPERDAQREEEMADMPLGKMLKDLQQWILRSPEEQARAILRREADLHRYVERTRPTADPQVFKGWLVSRNNFGSEKDRFDNCRSLVDGRKTSVLSTP